MKPYRIYSIAAHYRSVTVWEGSRMTHARMCVNKLTPYKHLCKQSRYDEIVRWLHKDFGIPAPVFNPTH